MITAIKNIPLIIMLSIFILLNGCSLQNASESLNESKLSNEYSITLAAQNFGQNLAKHILNHPEVVNDIVCKMLPLKISLLINDAKSDNTVAHNEKNKPEQLCTLTVDEYEPVYVTKVTFFIKDENGAIRVLNDLVNAGNASFSHFEFSEYGKYLYITFADEGHPFFVFFDTQKFINDDKNAEVGEVFEEYFLDHIESFYDNGDFVFAINEGTITGCLDGEIEIEPKTANTDEVKRCLFHHNIFDYYSSFSSSEPFTPSRSKRRINMPYVCNAFH